MVELLSRVGRSTLLIFPGWRTVLPRMQQEELATPGLSVLGALLHPHYLPKDAGAHCLPKMFSPAAWSGWEAAPWLRSTQPASQGLGEPQRGGEAVGLLPGQDDEEVQPTSWMLGPRGPGDREAADRRPGSLVTTQMGAATGYHQSRTPCICRSRK